MSPALSSISSNHNTLKILRTAKIFSVFFYPRCCPSGKRSAAASRTEVVPPMCLIANVGEAYFFQMRVQGEKRGIKSKRTDLCNKMLSNKNEKSEV